MWAYNKGGKSQWYCLIKQKRTEKVQPLPSWHHFCQSIIFVWANDTATVCLLCFHLSAEATFQIYSPFSLCCHRHAANQRTLWCTDALCHIGAMNYGHCGSLIGFQGLAVLNLDSLKTTSLRTSGFMFHGPFNKSKTKVYFFQFYWIVNLARNTPF